MQEILNKPKLKSDPEKVDAEISIWILILFFFTLANLYKIINFGWFALQDHFNKDPFMAILAYILIVGIFFIFPLIFSLGMKTIRIENFNVRINYILRFKKVTFNINDIKKCKSTYGDSNRLYEKFEIFLNDGQRVKIKAFELSNFQSVRNYILKYHKVHE
jgi:hypothetical protein